MAKIYADLLVAGARTWASVPAQIKEAVRVILKQYVVDGKITAERYEEITGEAYTA